MRPALSADWSYIEKCCGSCERNLIRRVRQRIDHHGTGTPKHRLPRRSPSRRRVLLLCCWIKSFRTGKNDKQVTSITRRISRERGVTESFPTTGPPSLLRQSSAAQLEECLLCSLFQLAFHGPSSRHPWNPEIPSLRSEELDAIPPLMTLFGPPNDPT